MRASLYGEKLFSCTREYLKQTKNAPRRRRRIKKLKTLSLSMRASFYANKWFLCRREQAQDTLVSVFCPKGFSKSVHPLVRISWTTRVKNLPHETKSPTMKCAHQQHKPGSPAHTITLRPCYVHVAQPKWGSAHRASALQNY